MKYFHRNLQLKAPECYVVGTDRHDVELIIVRLTPGRDVCNFVHILYTYRTFES